jgi:hypothetical protein
MAADGKPVEQPDDEGAVVSRHARFGTLPPRVRPEDWVEENETDPPAHELEQSISIVQHPGRTYET